MQQANLSRSPTLEPRSGVDAVLSRRQATVRAPLVSPVVLSGTVSVADLFMMIALGLGAATFYLQIPAAQLAPYAMTSAATALAASLLMHSMGLYDLVAGRARPLDEVRSIGAWTLSMAALAGIVHASRLGDMFSPLWLAGWYFAGVAGLIFVRVCVRSSLKSCFKSGHLVRRAVVYGHGAACRQLLDALEYDKDCGIRICGIFDDRDGHRDTVASRSEEHLGRGRLDDLVAFVRQSNVDLVLLALPISAEARLIDLHKRLWVLPADIRLVGSASRLKLSRRAYSYIGGVALIPLTDKPIADWGVVAKWLFDKVIGAAALLALSPVMLATAIAIRLDSRGPVLFRQKRYGFNNELIEIYKFRSMYVDQSDTAAAKLVTKDDPRVTRVGRFIRKTSLDELPQLFNVMIGNLSLVGPRPHAVSAKAGGKLYDEAVDSYFARHKVKPGITGWAQINGWRGETDTEEKLRRRIEHDLHYIENWSVFFDVYILAMTPIALTRTDNAY